MVKMRNMVKYCKSVGLTQSTWESVRLFKEVEGFKTYDEVIQYLMFVYGQLNDMEQMTEFRKWQVIQWQRITKSE